ncbi:MAG: NADH-quinone oxidoreductase subunit NuoE [Actinomycetia bacterium]|nr:NADH-quinone oxidoreductase subunit NuoE [Actinomycetes bacterium]
MAVTFGRQTQSGHLTVPAESKEPYPADIEATFREDAAAIIARYPQKRSALLPMLHLVQSIDGYITGRGIDLCAELLELSSAEVSGVATFYTQFKRHPNGEYTVGVCTNTLCAIMGGDEIWEAVSEHLGIGHDETTEDGKITLERVECNAACDYAPVVMTNWEFFDNQTPQSTIQLVDDLRAGQAVAPSRGPAQVRTFKEVSRVLAGFTDGLADEGVGAGPASLIGLELAKERGWTAPPATALGAPENDADGASTEGAPAAPEADGDAPGRTEVTPASPEADTGTQAAPDSADPADEAGDDTARTDEQVTDEDSDLNVGPDEIADVGATDDEPEETH